MNDRLEEIKKKADSYDARYEHCAFGTSGGDATQDIDWLIGALESARAEIERLQKEADVTFVNAAHEAIADRDRWKAQAGRLEDCLKRWYDAKQLQGKCVCEFCEETRVALEEKP